MFFAIVGTQYTDSYCVGSYFITNLYMVIHNITIHILWHLLDQSPALSWHLFNGLMLLALSWFHLGLGMS